MKSRIVYPAQSFQPPETCTEHLECQAVQASNADLCRAAQAHYDKVSTAAHEWHSAIPKAIDAYYADPERARLERLVIEAAKKWARDTETEPLFGYERPLYEAISMLIDFESSQGKRVRNA